MLIMSVILAGMAPLGIQAKEVTAETEENAVEAMSETGTEGITDGNDSAGASDGLTGNSAADTSGGLTENGAADTAGGQSGNGATDTSDGLNGNGSGNASEDGTESDVPGDAGDNGDGESGGQEIPDMIIPVVLPFEAGEEYAGLDEFLALSAEKFEIYTVAFVNAATGMPVQPEEPMEVSAAVPSDYNAERTVISEISMNGETPQRTELPCTIENGTAVFKTDHAGLYVVMEKKVQAELPPSLEPTDKVDRLDLVKTQEPASSLPSVSGTASVSRISSVSPDTGDQSAGIGYAVAGMALAAVAIVAVIIILVKNRRK